MLRPPAVAGRFYPDEPRELAREVLTMSGLPEGEQQTQAISCMVPHAGYRFSGHVAGAVYGRIKLPQSIVVIGPRHFPRGRAQAILSQGAWQTPLGPMTIDSELAGELMQACPALVEDVVAHREEHSIEVQLPFLQCLGKDVSFVPIALGPIGFAELEFLGKAIAGVVSRKTNRPLIVASSDMNHYEADDVTRQKDAFALERVLALDAPGLYETVRARGITMCGYGPTVSMLTAARLLGATQGKLVRYATSGDINGDRSQVVGYAGVIVE